MKDLGKTKFCLGLHIEHFPNGILVHQLMYTEKVLKHFYIEKTHHLSTQIVVRSLCVEKKPIFAIDKVTKKFLVLKYHILVQLVL
jgi:hypothetical protein